jgi:hypothetical protein
MDIIEKILPKPITTNTKELIARTFNSGFSKAHDTYNAISVASDGNVYYVLSSDSIDVGGMMYVYNPVTDKIALVGDLTQICGEQQLKAIPQGKSHVRFYESNGRMYFSTHIGYYESIEGMDRLPINAPEGFKLYPGGHILAYDLQTKEIIDLAIAPNGEGIVSMTMDREREHIYGITWPREILSITMLKKMS